MLTVGGAGGGGGFGFPARTSTAARFHRSFVGAVSQRLTIVPEAPAGDAIPCDQNVSPMVLSTCCESRICPGATVRPTAASQSMPAATAHEPAAVVVSLTDGAPLDALAASVAPMPAAPWTPRTVSNSSEADDPVVEVTVTPASADAAVASQISASPAWSLLRATRVHVSPAPDTVTVWLEPGDPSALTSASRSSPADGVENAGVVTVPDPDCCTDASMRKLPTVRTRVTLTVAALPTRPRASRTRAPSTCEPYGVPDGFQ